MLSSNHWLSFWSTHVRKSKYLLWIYSQTLKILWPPEPSRLRHKTPTRVFGKGPMCPTINGSGRVNAKLVKNPCIPFHPLIVEVGKKIISLTKDSRVSRRNDAFFWTNVGLTSFNLSDLTWKYDWVIFEIVNHNFCSRIQTLALERVFIFCLPSSTYAN